MFWGCMTKVLHVGWGQLALREPWSEGREMRAYLPGWSTSSSFSSIISRSRELWGIFKQGLLGWRCCVDSRGYSRSCSKNGSGNTGGLSQCAWLWVGLGLGSTRQGGETAELWFFFCYPPQSLGDVWEFSPNELAFNMLIFDGRTKCTMVFLCIFSWPLLSIWIWLSSSLIT